MTFYIPLPSVSVTDLVGTLPVSKGGTNSSTALTNGLVMVSAAGAIVESTMTTAQLATTPIWTKYSVVHTALQTDALTNNIEIVSLPAKTVVHNVVMKTTTAFAGTTTYTLSVGITGALTQYIAAQDAKAVVSNTNFFTSLAAVVVRPENFGAVTSVRLAAISTVENLDQSSAGAVDIYILTSLLP